MRLLRSSLERVAVMERHLKVMNGMRREAMSDDTSANVYRSMYLMSLSRLTHLIDHSYRYLMNGDIHGLIDHLMGVAEGFDYVDDTLREWHQIALDRWPILEEIEERAWES